MSWGVTAGLKYKAFSVKFVINIHCVLKCKISGHKHNLGDEILHREAVMMRATSSDLQGSTKRNSITGK